MAEAGRIAHGPTHLGNCQETEKCLYKQVTFILEETQQTHFERNI